MIGRFKPHRKYFCFSRPQQSCEGYVFTPVCQSFCSQGGGGVPGQVPPQAGIPLGRARYTPGTRYTPLGKYTPRAGTPPLPGQVHPPWAGTPPRQVHPLGKYTPGQVHRPSRRLLLRTVRILLECILVKYLLSN